MPPSGRLELRGEALERGAASGRFAVGTYVQLFAERESVGARDRIVEGSPFQESVRHEQAGLRAAQRESSRQLIRCLLCHSRAEVSPPALKCLLGAA